MEKDEHSEQKRQARKRYVLRKRFSAFQIDILEDAFQRDRYLNATVLDDLHGRLRLSMNQIKIWFRDRRRKWRKEQETALSLHSKDRSNTPSNRVDRIRVRSGCRSRRMKIINLKCSQSGCKVKCKTKAELNRHLMHSHAMLPFPCRAIGCDRAFVYSYQLAMHTQKTHSKDDGTMWQCGHCPKQFRSNANLRVHAIRLHEEGNFACGHENCNYIAPKHREELQRHIYRFHMEAKFDCQHPGCGRLFKTKANLKIHQSTHSNVPRKRGLPAKNLTNNQPGQKIKTTLGSVYSDIPERILTQINNCSQTEQSSDQATDDKFDLLKDAKPIDLSCRAAKEKNSSYKVSSSIRDYLEAFGKELSFSYMIESKEKEIREWICQLKTNSIALDVSDHTYCRNVDNPGAAGKFICETTADAAIDSKEREHCPQIPSPTPSVVYAGTLFSQMVENAFSGARTLKRESPNEQDRNDSVLFEDNASDHFDCFT